MKTDPEYQWRIKRLPKKLQEELRNGTWDTVAADVEDVEAEWLTGMAKEERAEEEAAVEEFYRDEERAKAFAADEDLEATHEEMQSHE